MVPSTADRGDAVTRLQEERSGVRGAEERRGGAAVRRLRAVRWGPDGPRDGASLRSGAPARELLPAVIQAQGEAPRGREGHQTLSSAGHAVRTCAGTPETRIGDANALFVSSFRPPMCGAHLGGRYHGAERLDKNQRISR